LATYSRQSSEGSASYDKITRQQSEVRALSRQAQLDATELAKSILMRRSMPRTRGADREDLFGSCACN
jgi:hypothetical protein